MPATRTMPGEISRFTARILRIQESITDLPEGAQDVRFKLVARSAEADRIVVLRRQPFNLKPGVVVEIVMRVARDVAAVPANQTADAD